MSGKVAAFACFGVKLRNDRWSWSGRTDNGKAVVLQLWNDHFDWDSDPISYSDFDDPRLPIWQNRRGNRLRIEDIKWAEDNCDGKFYVVLGTSKTIETNTRDTVKAVRDLIYS
jgi:hypothetical protein